MRKFVQFFAPFALTVLVGVLGYLWWLNQAWIPRGEPVEIDLKDVDIDTPFVRVEGMAHYPIKIRQTVASTLFSDERIYYLFPLFPPEDTSSKQVRVLVRTLREPDAISSYEKMTLEGHVTRPNPDKVPFSAELEFGKHSDYFFADDLWLIEPWRIIDAENEVWEMEP